MSAFNESQKNLANKKLSEIKKKIFLLEGRKKTLAEQFEQKKRSNQATLNDLKIKIQSYKTRKQNNELSENKSIQPENGKNLEQIVTTSDLVISDLVKHLNVINHRYRKINEDNERLLERYKDKLCLRDATNFDSTGTQPTVLPQTTERNQHRKVYCQLENKVNRTMIALVEAEHIRKKYKLIKTTLTFDAEKYEKYLHEMECFLQGQLVDIERLKVINEEALKLRDVTKLSSLRQENMSTVSLTSRQNDANTIQKEAEKKRIELEKLERKLFDTKRVVTQQNSTESLAADFLGLNKPQYNNYGDQEFDEMSSTAINHIKSLIVITGGTNFYDVLQRFIIQKETSSRLNYLRTITESDKKSLETERDQLRTQIDLFRFSDVKESEINQEHIEKIKNSIQQQQNTKARELQALQSSVVVLNNIKTILLDLNSRNNEISESVYPNVEINQFFDDKNISCEDFLKIFEIDLTKILEMHKESRFDNNLDDISINSEIKELKLDLVEKNTKQSDKDRYIQYPSYYNYLLMRRGTCGTASLSSGQSLTQGIMDEDGEIPSRNYLKSQAIAIVEVKSKRKNYRNVPKRK